MHKYASRNKRLYSSLSAFSPDEHKVLVVAGCHSCYSFVRTMCLQGLQALPWETNGVHIAVALDWLHEARALAQTATGVASLINTALIVVELCMHQGVCAELVSLLPPRILLGRQRGSGAW